MTRVQRILSLSALGLALMSPSAGAISVSDMRALSSLGEPLRMELELYDLGGARLDEIRIAQAQPADYSRLGLVAPTLVDDLSAQLRTDEKGRVLAVLQGHQPQIDPNVSLLLQLTWPDGVRLQQVAAVLSPSAVTSAVAPVVPVTAPASEVAASAQGSAATPASVVAGTEAVPVSPVQAPAAVAPVPMPAVAEPQVIAVTPAEPQASRPLHAPVEVAASTAPSASAADGSHGEVSLTLVNPASTPQARAAAGDAADLEAARTELLAERQSLRARQEALEAEAREQDARLKLLDAQLAALNSPAKSAAHKAVLTDAGSWSSGQTTGLVGGALLLLGLMVVLLRRSAARTERLAADAAALRVAVPEFEEFKPRDSLDAFAAPASATATVAPEAAASAPTVDALLAAASADVQDDSAADEPEYDFLTDSEAAAFQTRLDLAMAYLDMNEQSAAKELLERVLEGGTSEQRRQASALLAAQA